MNNYAASETAKASWSIDRWLSYLLAIHPNEIDMGLSRVNKVYTRLSMQWQNTKVITVAGTNGKGSTCRFMEMALLKLGYSVGVYSSPHLNDYRERVRINGISPNEDAFCQAFQAIERARGDESLTYFEFGTLAALSMLQQQAPDFMILEVGLGGRLDATNIIDTDLAVITSIGIDHQEYLGDTRESVASEKSGIFRTDIPIVIGEAEPPEVLLSEARSKTSQVMLKGRDFKHYTDDKGSIDQWSWTMADLRLNDLPKSKLFVENISTAMAALHALGVFSDLCNKGLLNELISNTSLPGRMQVIKNAPLWVVDVGHNPQAAELLTRYLKEAEFENLYIILGMMKDKAIAKTLRSFNHFGAYWFPVTLSSARAATAADLGQYLGLQKVVGEFDSVQSAVESVQQRATNKDAVLVFGSFVTVADVLTLHQQGGI